MMLIIIGVFVVVFLLLRTWRYLFVPSLKNVKGGYQEDVTLPHTDPVELYFADVSSNSMKVRMCLAEAGISFKQNIVHLIGPEMKQAPFLSINPAGTVPVLVHNGHPIYESTDQIKYIATKLVPSDDRKLIPEDSILQQVNDYWLEKTSMYMSEIFGSNGGMEIGLRKRAGNSLPLITMPYFALRAKYISLKTFFATLLYTSFGPKFFLQVFFFIFGVHTLEYFPGIVKSVKLAFGELRLHLIELEEYLNKSGTKFICGEQVVLADFGWAIILERMEMTGWMDHLDENKYHCVLEYWENIKLLSSYKEATKLIKVDKAMIITMKNDIQKLKEQYDWFKNLYE